MSLTAPELKPVLEAIDKGDLEATFHSEDIRRAVFERIDEMGCYQELLGTSFLYPMVSHLVSVNKLHKLVRFSLEHKREQAAKDMIRLYNQTHGRSEPESDEALVQEFLDLEKDL
jgi:hypothetical protein